MGRPVGRSGRHCGDRPRRAGGVPPDTLHNRVLVEGVAGKFDVGKFSIGETGITPDAELDFQVTIEDFPTSWQEATPRERSHDSRIYTARFMLRLNQTSSLKLQDLVDHFHVPKAQIIRQLIAQAEPEDFPKSWQMRAAERHAPRVP